MTNNEIEKYSESIFDSIKHIDEFGNEYWFARELQKVLEYNKWENFIKVIDKAKTNCSESGYDINYHFPEVRKMVKTGDSIRNIADYKLSRYACYLILLNGDPKKNVVSLGKTYFTIQTRKQELTEEEYERLSEDDKRLYRRKQIKDGNYLLNKSAFRAGVKNFDKFHNSGYRGLYNGETADDIAKRKGLRYREDILDNMGSSELIANMFRIDQTEQKLQNDNIETESEANKVHYKVGKIVRNAIKKVGGTMPENLPTPYKSLKKLGKEGKKKIRI